MKLKSAAPASMRVAGYCRVSTDKRLAMEFNSLDAQREAIENYVRSQAEKGWRLLPEMYHDGGFTGANINRPAFQRMMEDIAQGRIDIVVVYRLDRISRSLLDFTKMMSVFQEHGVTFASVSQPFDTTTSAGEFFVNQLMAFAQFERQQISERTRDKIRVSRERGMWVGGHPPLGYDAIDKKLVIVEEEAVRVREIFQLYLSLGSLGEVVNELKRRGWRGKDRRNRPGVPFNKSMLRRLLTTVLYRGLVPSNGDVFPGQHEAIVDEKDWAAVQSQLKQNRRNGGSTVRNKWGMLLRGLLRCARCGQPMQHSYSTRGNKKYHYYRCQSHALPGNGKCPGARAPARELETFVIARIRDVGKDPSIITATLDEATAEVRRQKPELESEARRDRQETQRLSTDRENLLQALARSPDGAEAIGQRLGELDATIEKLDHRATEIRNQLIAMESGAVDKEDLRAALARFDQIWDQLIPREQARVLQLLIQEISFDGQKEEVQITYRPGGVRFLAEETA